MEGQGQGQPISPEELALRAMVEDLMRANPGMTPEEALPIAQARLEAGQAPQVDTLAQADSRVVPPPLAAAAEGGAIHARGGGGVSFGAPQAAPATATYQPPLPVQRPQSIAKTAPPPPTTRRIRNPLSSSGWMTIPVAPASGEAPASPSRGGWFSDIASLSRGGSPSGRPASPSRGGFLSDQLAGGAASKIGGAQPASGVASKIGGNFKKLTTFDHPGFFAEGGGVGLQGRPPQGRKPFVPRTLEQHGEAISAMFKPLP